jgi:hypothetical protein
MTEQPLIDDFPLRLSRRFRRQQAFAAGYAPLSSRVCGLLADWLEVGADRDPVAAWLLAAGRGRASFDVPLLLLAGLHREVLAGEPAVVELARYYPSAGGALDPAGAGFAAALRAALLALRPQLAAFLQQASVQTNEVVSAGCCRPASPAGPGCTWWNWGPAPGSTWWPTGGPSASPMRPAGRSWPISAGGRVPRSWSWPRVTAPSTALTPCRRC